VSELCKRRVRRVAGLAINGTPPHRHVSILRALSARSLLRSLTAPFPFACCSLRHHQQLLCARPHGTLLLADVHELLDVLGSELAHKLLVVLHPDPLLLPLARELLLAQALRVLGTLLLLDGLGKVLARLFSDDLEESLGQDGLVRDFLVVADEVEGVLGGLGQELGD
jgi:hypothetical protein